MNILIPHSWLKEFIKTEATPETIAEKLSLHSLSVEKLHKKGSDTIYEIETTPNRCDTLSILGVAREAAAALPCPFLHPKGGNNTAIISSKRDLLKVKITNPDLCPRFTAIVLDNIEIKSSPKLIKDRLEMSGIRALNNVVDVSNYLMLELGQPMHIFDFDKIVGGKMVLRESRKDEQLVTLDGLKRQIPKGAIVIESGGKLIDLCGIMGGKNSEVGENTKRILLFIQIYDPIRIRKTSQKLSLRTEASTRFEKGVDPEGILPAMVRAVEMLKENANARIASKLVDIKNKEWQQKEVELELPEVTRLLGIRIEKEKAIEILKSLGFNVTTKEVAFQIPTLLGKVPSWRDKDITIPADLIEEIARIYGYHNLPNLMPEGAIPPTPQEEKFYWEDKAKDFLKHQGFFEVYNYSFAPEGTIKIKNPLNKDLEYLRPSLLPSLLQNFEENKNRQDNLRLFELERVYLPKKGQELPQENFRLTGVVQGSFYTVKGIIEGLLKELGIKDITFQPSPQNPPIISVIHLQGEESAFSFDLDFDALTKLASDLKTYEPIPEYPPILEDLSFILPPKTFIADVISLIKKQSQLIRNVELIDRYPEKGSVTLRLTYRHAARTLTDDDAAEVRQKIITALEKNLSAKIRSK